MKHTTGIGRNVISPRARQALFAVPLAILLASCGPRPGCGAKESDPAQAATWDARRMDMVQHLRTYGVTHANVLAAMGKIRRHLFIPED